MKGSTMRIECCSKISKKEALQNFVIWTVWSLVGCAALIAPALAGSPPNLLDDNRGDTALELIESAAFTAAALVVLESDPLTTLINPVVVVSGRVLAHPKIHNLYLDDDWDAHNPDAPTREQIDAFTRALVAGPYFDAAGQYGVGTATFTGSHGTSFFCSPLGPRASTAEFVEILAWISCEVGFPTEIPFLPTASGVPRPDDDTLYVVYLPRSVSIAEGGCAQFSGYHFFSATTVWKTVFEIIPDPVTQTFAFAVIPTRCASGTTLDRVQDQITESASHEIIEASTDPLVGTGWINNSVVTNLHGSFFSELVMLFSNIALDLMVGEAADICQQTSNPQTGPPAFQHPTPPALLPVDDPELQMSLGNRISVAPYWSNNGGFCAPLLPNSLVPALIIVLDP
jgi:hypothetical protein